MNELSEDGWVIDIQTWMICNFILIEAKFAINPTIGHASICMDVCDCYQEKLTRTK